MTTGDLQRHLRMWRERGGPVWTWLADMTLGASITALLFWLVPHVV